MLDPQVKELLERVAAAARPPYYTLTPTQAREEYRRARKPLQPSPPEVAAVDNRRIPGLHGPIDIRLIRPLNALPTELLPALIYFHGGGFTIGDLDTHDTLCRSLANEARCAVVSVDYRLGPENKFPKAVDDSVAATRWVAANAESMHVDAARLAVGGDSAGGNLAAVTALIARDGGGPALAFQLLIYPVTQTPHRTPSFAASGQGYLLTQELVEYFDSNYLRNPKDGDDWRCSPLLASDFSRLPPAFVLTAGFDPLRDEGRAYADKLQAAGVTTTYRCYDGMIHGFIAMGRVLDAANLAVKECAAALTAAFKR